MKDRISIYDKREDFAFRIVNFPHMDSNIPANPAYGVYISQLMRYARICTSKVDFINRLRGLSLRLRHQGFETNLLQKSFNKFFSRHGLIVEKYGAALREMRLAIQAWIAPSYPYITYLLHNVVFQLYFATCAGAILFWARALFVCLFIPNNRITNITARRRSTSKTVLATLPGPSWKKVTVNNVATTDT